jgi:hypothetical protein
MMNSLTDGEQQALDLSVDLMKAIQNIDGDKLEYNAEELCEAIHVCQAFIKQHVCYRLVGYPTFSNWYGDDGS